jgi:hypothetical protein
LVIPFTNFTLVKNVFAHSFCKKKDVYERRLFFDKSLAFEFGYHCISTKSIKEHPSVERLCAHSNFKTMYVQLSKGRVSRDVFAAFSFCFLPFNDTCILHGHNLHYRKVSMKSSGAYVIIWDEMLSSGIKCYNLEPMLSSGMKCYYRG